MSSEIRATLSLPLIAWHLSVTWLWWKPDARTRLFSSGSSDVRRGFDRLPLWNLAWEFYFYSLVVDLTRTFFLDLEAWRAFDLVTLFSFYVSPIIAISFIFDIIKRVGWGLKSLRGPGSVLEGPPPCPYLRDWNQICTVCVSYLISNRFLTCCVLKHCPQYFIHV